MDFDFQNKLKIEAGNDLMMMMMLQMEKMLPENANVSSPGLPGEEDHEGSFCRVNNGVRSGVGGAVTSLPPAFYDHVQQSSFMGNSSTTSSSDAPGGIPFLPPEEIKRNSSMAVAMREMIFRVAAMQPVHIDPESVRPPKRRNVKISKDPQSVAARHRRERISERIRILQRLVPGGTKMDTASMLDEAVHYVKFLKKQVQSLEKAGAVGFPPPAAAANLNYVSLMRACQLGSLQSCRDSSC